MNTLLTNHNNNKLNVKWCNLYVSWVFRYFIRAIEIVYNDFMKEKNLALLKRVIVFSWSIQWPHWLHWSVVPIVSTQIGSENFHANRNSTALRIFVHLCAFALALIRWKIRVPRIPSLVWKLSCWKDNSKILTFISLPTLKLMRDECDGKMGRKSSNDLMCFHLSEITAFCT